MFRLSGEVILRRLDRLLRILEDISDSLRSLAEGLPPSPRDHKTKP